MCSRKWLLAALVVCGLASACSDYNTNLSVQTSSSVLTFVSPSSASAGSQGFTITANGSGFTTGALILWNGTALTTTLVSSVQLTAPVPASDLATAATVQVAVQIPGSASSATSNVNNTTTTEISNVVLFQVGAPAGTPPAVTSLSASTTSASSTPYCSATGLTLTVNGTNFTSDAVVNWNGSGRATTFVSATQLTAAITPSDTAFAGSAAVTVSNSSGTSNSKAFTMVTPTAALPTPGNISVSPSSSAAGNSTITITVQGANILPCTLVQWVSPANAASTLATTFVPAQAANSTSAGNPIEVTAAVPSPDFQISGTTPQTACVVAFNGTPPAPNVGGCPASQQFTISPPSISGVSASTSMAASTPSCSTSPATLTVTGANFTSNSMVNWIVVPPAPAAKMISALATTFVSSTQLTAVVPASLTASTLPASDTLQIAVSNFSAASNNFSFSITPALLPVPAIATVLPATATAGSAGASLTVTGGNLLPCSVVQWTAGRITTQLATTYVSANLSTPPQLIAAVPAADITSVGTAQITVLNPPIPAGQCPPPGTNCGGGTSNAESFAIVLPTVTSLSASTTGMNNTPYCSSAGLTLTVNGTGFAQGLVVNWNGSPRPTTFVSATQMTAAITPADTAYLATGAAAVAITVSSGPATNSNSLKFSLTALPTGTTLPVPALSSLSPASAAVEALTGSPVALAVNGSNLSPCSTLQWNGSQLPANIFIGTSGMATFLPAANLTAPGANQVTAISPGTAASNAATFTVFTPGTPGATSITGAPLSLPLMSSAQRYDVYVLASTDGTTETPGSLQNVFVSDTCTGVASGCTPANSIVSIGSGAAAANGDSIAPSISASAADTSADGRFVTFLSTATNLITGGTTNGVMNAFVRDTCAGTTSGCTPSTQLVSVATNGTEANGATTSATIDSTGRYVIFESAATNLGATLSSGGIFVRDTCAGVASGCTPSTQSLQ